MKSVSLFRRRSQETQSHSRVQTPKPEVAMCWNHLKPTASKLRPYRSDLEVGLLIGINCLKAIKPRKIILDANTDPYGIRTDLGWVIVDRGSLSPSRFRSESSRGDCDKK